MRAGIIMIVSKYFWDMQKMNLTIVTFFAQNYVVTVNNWNDRIQVLNIEYQVNGMYLYGCLYSGLCSAHSALSNGSYN